MRVDVVALAIAGVLAGCGVSGHVSPYGAGASDAGGAPVAPASPAPDQLGCIAHPRIDVWERRLRTRRALRASVGDDLARGARYLPRLRPIVAEAGLPAGLALLPAVESGFDPRAHGPLDERGLWQLRAATARRFGLVVTWQRDDRLAAEPATRAALRYLRFLHARYGDWALALAAYNAGEGRVDRARARRPTATFWELVDAGLLSRGSRDYVPRFLAVVRMSERSEPCRRPSDPTAAPQSYLRAARVRRSNDCRRQRRC